MPEHSQILTRLILSACVVLALGLALYGSSPRENPYPELDQAARRFQQGLDLLDVPLNTPFDTAGAVNHFNAVLESPEVDVRIREAVMFLLAYTQWAQPEPAFKEANETFKAYLQQYPTGAWRADAYYTLALIALHDPEQPDPAIAASWLKQTAEAAPGAPLAIYATSTLAELYRTRLDNPGAAAVCYGQAFDISEDAYPLDERLNFLYAQGKLLRQTGRADAAVAVFNRMLEQGAGGAGVWTSRVLDRLDELGAPAVGDFFGGLDTQPIPMTDHRFTPRQPVEISVSFWILEKTGMRRGIEAIVANYEARNPGVKVRVVDLPYEGYHDWLQSQILGQDIPDIVQIDNGSAIRYGAYQNRMEDMTPHLSAVNPYTGRRWADMYYPQFMLNARDPVYRKNWIISWASENTAFLYNKDAFRKAGIVQRAPDGQPLTGADGKELVAEPATWDELIMAFQKLRDIGVYGELCGFFPDPAPIIWQLPFYRKQIYADLIAKYDTDFPDDYPDPFEMANAVLNGTMDLRDPQIAAPWRLLYDKCEYWLPGGTAMDIPQVKEAFAGGKAATLFWVSTDLPTFEAICPFEVGVFPFPSLKGSPWYDGEYAEEFNLSAFEFAVPKATGQRGNLPAALDFLMYYTSPEAQEILSRESVCVSPIRGVPAPEKLKPFLTHMNRRGTFQIYFDPYTIGIIKEPYWVDGRDKLWNELNRLMGDVPNYDYFQRQTGGSPEVYRRWRDEQFDSFTQGLQDYFKFAYERLVQEYPDDVRREIKRARNQWISSFRAGYFPPPGMAPVDSGEQRAKMDSLWRGLSDHWSIIGRCEKMARTAPRSGAVVRPAASYHEQKQARRIIQIALMLLATVMLLALLWAGVLGRMLRDRAVLIVLLPTLFLLGVFAYTPALSAVYHAFFLWNGSDICEFLGLGNFRMLLRDSVLFDAVRVMLVFLVANIMKFAPTIAIAVILFHLVNTKLQYMFRVIFVLPMAIPGIVGLLIWKYFYRMDGGVLNWVLLNIGAIRAPINWLGNEDTVVPALLFLGFPWVSTIGVLILLAGLQSIPQSVFDASQVDGCGVWRRFWSIELPLILGQIKLNIVLITIGTIQDFWLPLVLTRGGPNNASMLPGLWMYQNAFSYGKMGYAAALGVAMFLVILCLTFINMRFITVERDE